MKSYIWLALPLALILGYLVLIPAQATVLRAWVWPADQTPAYLETALRQRPEINEAGRRYYFVHYSIEIRSLLPFRLMPVHAEAQANGGQLFEIQPDFVRRVERFQRTAINATFLMDVDSGTDAEKMAKEANLFVRVGTKTWPRIPVRVAPSLEIIRKPAVE
ncbi:MAG: hypothetical protein ACOY94_05960 [Bacillota bacterium]